MANQRILVIEDDTGIRRGIVDAVRFAGYETLEAPAGDVGLTMALGCEVDLVLLDLVLPGRDGFEVLDGIRRERGPLPVIILTARGDEADRVRGLRNGADDYVVKPFSVKELLARVEAVLRRCAERPPGLTEIEIPGGRIDLSRREVRFQSQVREELSEKEVELIRYLATNSGRSIAREELLQNVWGISPRGVSTRTIDMHVARLREKLHDDPAEPRILLTVRGKGYMFAAASGGSDPP